MDYGTATPWIWGECIGHLSRSCLPPPHQYLAFYHWVRNVFQADAVIHVGTHGSLEWLPGKGAGLSASCYPEIGISSLPNIYPYWTTIVGKAYKPSGVVRLA